MTTTLFPLGRIVNHDPRSREYPARMAPVLRTIRHRHYGPVLHQGALGSCTGNAMAQALMTAPLRVKGRVLTEADAVSIYSEATTFDTFPGTYPPTDTGSSGLSVAKAAQRRGLIAGYTHAFGLDQCLAALVLGPVLVGTTWTEGMYSPNAAGFAQATGLALGGHEYCLVGLNLEQRYVTAINSWGVGWGKKGFFRLTFDTLDTLLRDQGDCTIPSE